MSLGVFASSRVTLLFAAAICAALIGLDLFAAEITADRVLEGLDRPCAVVARPGGTVDRFELYIAESGAGRVIKWANTAPQETPAAVTGFESHPAADPLHQAGPMALSFLDPGLLVVGTTRDEGGNFVRAYELPEGDQSLSASEQDAAKANQHADDGSTCVAMARTRANGWVPDMLVLAIRSASGDTRLVKTRVQAGTIGKPQPFGPADTSESPRAVAISNSGRVIVAGADGRLRYFSPIDGQLELELATAVKQPSGLAYSPTSGSLYVADFTGGIYRIDDTSAPGRPACQTAKVADAVRPTSLAFGPDGALYFTTFGNSDADGTLEVLTGSL